MSSGFLWWCTSQGNLRDTSLIHSKYMAQPSDSCISISHFTVRKFGISQLEALISVVISCGMYQVTINAILLAETCQLKLSISCGRLSCNLSSFWPNKEKDSIMEVS